MAIKLKPDEAVIRDGERWTIGDKCYAKGYGVVYLEEIEVLGVHFGFRAKVSGCLVDGDVWLPSRALSHDFPDWAEQRADELTE